MDKAALRNAISGERGRLGNRARLVRSIYAICLLGATLNHGRAIAAHGLFWDYGGVPRATAAFWTSLVVIDPVGALLLAIRPKAGVMMTAAIIVVDIIHNLWIGARHAAPPLSGLTIPRPLLAQMAFLIFVLLTVQTALRTRNDPPAARDRRERRQGEVAG